MRLAVICACTLAAAMAMPAAACSVVSGYRVPSNLELAAGADLIMIGRVTGGTAKGDPDDWHIDVEPVGILKGAAVDGRIELSGMALATGPMKPLGGVSDPHEFEAAHPASYVGGCIRYAFPQRALVLFFLDTASGRWRPAGGPFSRWAEDVPGPDAPWVQLVRLYIQAAALPRDRQLALLQAERDRLLALDDRVSRLMAADIARQTGGPTPPWNSLSGKQMDGLGAGPEAAATAIADALLAADKELQPGR